jgi:hypothetical protein
MLLAAAVPWTQARIDARLGRHRAQEEVLYLWSGEQVRRLVPGFEDLLADVYWLRTVQYFGGQRVYAANKRFDLLLPLVDITVTLDPRLQIAYRYGATYLAETYPIGAGQPQAAVSCSRAACGTFRTTGACGRTWACSTTTSWTIRSGRRRSSWKRRDAGITAVPGHPRRPGAHEGGRPSDLAAGMAPDLRAGRGAR